jgi:hypothetical protein
LTYRELLLLQGRNCIVQIEHVKGHQDTATHQRDLTYEEILNIEAYELTHIAQKLPAIKNYEQYPNNKVNLKLNNKYINSQYSKMVNLAFHSLALREYYLVQYNWSSQDPSGGHYIFNQWQNIPTRINFVSKSS